MVEVVFGENATGSLKLAQAYGKGAYLGGAVGVILHEDGREAAQEEIEAALQEARAREKAAWESAVPLGGSAAGGRFAPPDDRRARGCVCGGW